MNLIPSCTVLMVALDKKTSEEVYVGIEFEMENEILPENNSKDINRCVYECNKINDEYKYIDMFGIIKDGIVELWEVPNVELEKH